MNMASKSPLLRSTGHVFIVFTLCLVGVGSRQNLHERTLVSNRILN